MLRRRWYTKKWRGATLIEALVMLSIFGIISVVFAQSWSVATQLILEARNRLGASSIAAEKLEIVRNLSYASIGTKTPNGSGGWSYGIPAGEILQDETITANNHTYQVHTFVEYIDDPFDGKANSNPADAIPNDYKKAFITVSWGNGGSSQQVELSSIFVPNGIEQDAGGGVLSINTLDFSGNSIANATVHIVNNQTNPTVDVTAQTDATGNLILPAAPVGQQSYQITVSKAGYFTDHTYPIGGAFTPTEPHMSVVAGQTNLTSLSTDQVINLTLKTKDTFGVDVPNVTMAIVGGKLIGNTPDTYSYVNATATSGATASFTLADASPGMYTVTQKDPAGYVFLHIDPAETNANQIVTIPGQTKTSTLVFANQAVASLIMTIKKEADSTPLAGASVHVTSAAGYDATVLTDVAGQAYFPTDTTPLPAGDYTVVASATGFVNKQTTVTITNALVQNTLLLEAN